MQGSQTVTIIPFEYEEPIEYDNEYDCGDQRITLVETTGAATYLTISELSATFDVNNPLAVTGTHQLHFNVQLNDYPTVTYNPPF
jgi:hypothetical protein